MSIDLLFTTLGLLVLLALAFDFMNGFHDAANSIATVVSTRVLKPYQAVVWAAFFNFVAIFIFHLKVAATVGKGIVDPLAIDHYVIFGALIGAILWNLITWYFGIPSSSSHALVGGLVGAGGLGSPAALYLAAAGIGTLGLVEFDRELRREEDRSARQTGARARRRSAADGRRPHGGRAVSSAPLEMCDHGETLL